jgi:hypothetical protein
MPYPHAGESKREYIARFMASEEAKHDYPGISQRYKVALELWKRYQAK